MTRPRVTLKLATSLDGRIATATGESKWITGEAAREQVHKLRAQHQAILIGVDTAIADDPQLTVRLPGFVGLQPTRVVLDSRQRLSPASKLALSARRIPVVVVTVSEPKSELEAAGVAVLRVAEQDGRPDLNATLAALGAHQGQMVFNQLEAMRAAGSRVVSMPRQELARGYSLMVEGGGQVAASFLAADLVDAIEWFRAPIVLGDEGQPGVGAFALKDLSAAPRFTRVAVHELGPDLWERYERL